MDFFGIGTDKSQLLLAGALGGMVRWLTLRSHWSDGLIAIVVGAICALYVSPLALPAMTPFLGNLGVPAESSSGLAGFLIGLGGITVSGLIMDIWRARRKLVDEGGGPKKGGGV